MAKLPVGVLTTGIWPFWEPKPWGPKTIKRRDPRKTIVLVGIYNQQFQGTIILMVFDFQGKVDLFGVTELRLHDLESVPLVVLQENGGCMIF